MLPSQSSSWPLQVSTAGTFALQVQPLLPLQVLVPTQLPDAFWATHVPAPSASSMLPSQLSSMPLQLSCAGMGAVQPAQPLPVVHVSTPKHEPAGLPREHGRFWPTSAGPQPQPRGGHAPSTHFGPHAALHAAAQTLPEPKSPQTIPGKQSSTLAQPMQAEVGMGTQLSPPLGTQPGSQPPTTQCGGQDAGSQVPLPCTTSAVQSVPQVPQCVSLT